MNLVLARVIFGTALVVGGGGVIAAAQTASDGAGDVSVRNRTTATTEPDRQFAVSLAGRLLKDQKYFWTSPLRVKPGQLPRFVVLGAGLGLLTQIDHDIQHRSGFSHAARLSRASDAGVALFAGTSGAFYAIGSWKGDEHARETGLLSSEAVINSLLSTTALQRAFGRARPQDSSAGDFFRAGSSFPSNHSAASWAAAAVFAREYPGWGTKLLSYGLASAVSLSRVGGQQHFLSDTVVGGALGWLIGDQIYSRHHDPALPGQSFGTFLRSRAESVPDPMHQGSTYVPIDSWAYIAFDRLAALGFVQRGFQGMRPWTRSEFGRLLNTASASDMSEDPEATKLYASLLDEFSGETGPTEDKQKAAATVDSVYMRITAISGPPLNDALHFGETFIDDYGRPYQRGLNAITGISTRAEAGPLAFYVRGEYQHAPSAPALSEDVRTALAATDGLPVSPAVAVRATDRIRLLDAYVALNLSGWQASFGKQSLWWGPDVGGDLMFTNNAEPVTMLRLSRITPFKLPSLLGLLGDIRSESFLGQLDGTHFLRLGPEFTLTGSYDHFIDPQPYVWGQKISLQPTRNLEVGISMTSVFAGLGRPLTFGTFKHSLSFSGNAQRVEPGDRRTGFDFTYRVPGLRNRLILYNGSMSEDQPNPIAYPRQSAMNPGIYIPRVPKLSHLDFRVESAYTNLPNGQSTLFYTNRHYAAGFTNNGVLMGHWIGPSARALQLWSTYWFSGATRLRLGYRTQTFDPGRLNGGDLRDLSAALNFVPQAHLAVAGQFQYERWKMPVLSNAPQDNYAISIQLAYQPFIRARRKQ